jgi:hypothetical protein
MHDNLLYLLRQHGRIRRLDARTCAELNAYFRHRVQELLSAEARRHPLGFVLIYDPLIQDRSLRYHLWPVGWGVPEGQETGEIHDHRYELNSIVVAGSLGQFTYDPNASTDGTHRVYEVKYEAQTSELLDADRWATLREIADDHFSAGTAYRLEPRAVHRIETLQRPAASIVLTISQPRSPTPRVFVPRGRQPPPTFSRGTLTAPEIADIRRQLDTFG